MIDDLDRSLEALLREELPGPVVEQVAISFAPPDEGFPPQSVALPALDLFLYDLRENRELRSSVPELEPVGNGFRRVPAPIRVDCSYMVTAWASESSSTRAQDEHRLLGEAMLALLRHPTLPATVLQGRLEGQEPPLPSASLQPGRLQSMGEFWQAMGGRPKAAFDYTVTIALQPWDATAVGRVEERDFIFRERMRVRDEVRDRLLEERKFPARSGS